MSQAILIEQKRGGNNISIPIVIESLSDKHNLLNITSSQLNLDNMENFKTFIKTVIDDIMYPLTGNVYIYIKDSKGIPIDTSINGSFYNNVQDDCLNDNIGNLVFQLKI